MKHEPSSRSREHLNGRRASYRRPFPSLCSGALAESAISRLERPHCSVIQNHVGRPPFRRNLRLREPKEHWSAGSPKQQGREQQSDELRLQNPNHERAVRIPVDRITLEGDLVVPDAGRGLVLFAHGSGSSRHSPRNRYVAQVLQQAGFATLLMDLLTMREEQIDSRTGALRFDIGLLARRLIGATRWLIDQPDTAHLPIGYFGASTGAAAALVAAAELRNLIAAIVSRGGRPDLAG